MRYALAIMLYNFTQDLLIDYECRYLGTTVAIKLHSYIAEREAAGH